MDAVLLTRIKTAVMLLVPLSLILWIGGLALGLLSIALFLVINYEFYSLHRYLGRPRQAQFIAVNCLPILGYVWTGWVGFAGGVVLGSMFILLLNVIILESETHEVSFEELTPTSMLGFVYLGILASMMVVVATADNANIRMSWLLSVVIVSDSFAYLFGSRIGGPKISPRISPNKTIAGSVCGLIGGVLAGVIASDLLGLHYGVLQSLGFGLLAGMLAQAGDLIESLVKRIYQVKDIGNILPGHGGILDRIDAFVFACPVLFFLGV
jgi:phosphatidate cytidylyltransferase